MEASAFALYQKFPATSALSCLITVCQPQAESGTDSWPQTRQVSRPQNQRTIRSSDWLFTDTRNWVHGSEPWSGGWHTVGHFVVSSHVWTRVWDIFVRICSLVNNWTSIRPREQHFIGSELKIELIISNSAIVSGHQRSRIHHTWFSYRSRPKPVRNCSFFYF
jgi:hypothetical protein